MKTRPLDPKYLIKVLHQKASISAKPGRATSAQIGLVAAKLEECFDSGQRKARRTVLRHVWQIDSANALTFAQASAMLDWLLDKDSTDDDYPLHPHAADEARRLHWEALRSEGQMELF